MGHIPPRIEFPNCLGRLPPCGCTNAENIHIKWDLTLVNCHLQLPLHYMSFSNLGVLKPSSEMQRPSGSNLPHAELKAFCCRLSRNCMINAINNSSGVFMKHKRTWLNIQKWIPPLLVAACYYMCKAWATHAKRNTAELAIRWNHKSIKRYGICSTFEVLRIINASDLFALIV